MSILTSQKSKVKPGKRIIPKTYTLRALGELLKEYEKTVSSIAARSFVRWLEAREKLNDLRITKRFYGIE